MRREPGASWRDRGMRDTTRVLQRRQRLVLARKTEDEDDDGTLSLNNARRRAVDFTAGTTGLPALAR